MGGIVARFIEFACCCRAKLAAPLEDGEPLLEHLLALLQRLLLGEEHLLALRETLTEVGRLLEDDHLGRPVRRLQVRDERSQKLESITQIDSPLALHRVVLGALLAVVLRVARRPQAPLAWRRARCLRVAQPLARPVAPLRRRRLRR